MRASIASEPRERSAPAKRRARECVGESEGQSPSDKIGCRTRPPSRECSCWLWLHSSTRVHRVILLKSFAGFTPRKRTRRLPSTPNFFYAIDGAAIGKYDKRSGARVAGWNDSSGTITHLDSGIVVGSELYCAHSNYPETPMVSSLEVFDTNRLGHLRSIQLPQGIGSATWVEHAHDAWWVTFANYAGRGGEPGKGPETTKMVRFDRQWQPQESWTFPPAVVQRWEGMSSSGGVWVEGKGLYTTGHDARELYVLDLPASGHELTLKAIVPFESEGQGIAIDSVKGCCIRFSAVRAR